MQDITDEEVELNGPDQVKADALISKLKAWEQNGVIARLEYMQRMATRVRVRRSPRHGEMEGRVQDDATIKELGFGGGLVVLRFTEYKEDRSGVQPFDISFKKMETEDFISLNSDLFEGFDIGEPDTGDSKNPLLDYYDEQNGGKGWGDYKSRAHGTGTYAWAIPDEEAIEAIVKLERPIIEIGAGRGYWADLICKAGGDIIAFDNAVPHSDGANHYHEKNGLFFDVQDGSYEKIADHPERILFLCWPPYRSSLALDCLEAYSGDTLIYVGESAYGCTGCDDFHGRISSHWEFISSVSIPQWAGIHDNLEIFRRK